MCITPVVAIRGDANTHVLSVNQVNNMTLNVFGIRKYNICYHFTTN